MNTNPELRTFCPIIVRSWIHIAPCVALFSFSNAHAAPSANWPQFRGPHASGVSADVTPITWNAESGENIRWQTSIPGLGHACSIVWGERVYIATAIKPSGKSDLKIGL